MACGQTISNTGSLSLPYHEQKHVSEMLFPTAPRLELHRVGYTQLWSSVCVVVYQSLNLVNWGENQSVMATVLVNQD